MILDAKQLPNETTLKHIGFSDISVSALNIKLM